MAKVEVLDWNDFFVGKINAKGVFSKCQTLSPMIYGVIGATVISSLKMGTAYAFSSATLMHAFTPLITAIQALSFPVSFIGMAGGMLLVSVGQRHKGVNMIKWAAIGYIGMQLVPGLMGMVSDVGKSIGAAN